MSRSTTRRTHIGVFDDDEASIDGVSGSVERSSVINGDADLPSNAARVMDRARGKRRDRMGAKGLERRVEMTEPRVVRAVEKMVARMGFIKAPDRTERRVAPGMDQLVFQTVANARRARTWN